MKFTTSDGYEYIQDSYGIHQLNAKPFSYDEKYCAIYDDPDREQKSDVLQAARLGVVLTAHGKQVESILDIGSGNFAFLKAAAKLILNCEGYDIANYPVPKGIIKTDKLYNKHDVITFWDCLEHFAEPEFVRGLNCGTLVISLPNRDNAPEDVFVGSTYREWFDKEYFHRKPNEHLHHYSPDELQRFMLYCGWHQVCCSNVEDIVRTRGNWNIITAAFKRK